MPRSTIWILYSASKGRKGKKIKESDFLKLVDFYKFLDHFIIY